MIETIKWPFKQSPFLKVSGKNTLKITLHSMSFEDLSKEEEAAIALIKEFRSLPKINIMDTIPGKYTYLIVEVPNEDNDIPYRVMRGKKIIEEDLFYTSFNSPESSASALGGRSDYPVTEAEWELARLGWGHTYLERHIFVTKSRFLLAHRDELWIGSINPRTPQEASKILGTFLRSMNNYTYRISPKDGQKESRERTFYYALARHRAPILWRFLDACDKAGTERGDDLENMGTAVAFRCLRALSARDKLGSAFYSTGTIDLIETMEYHFDYLCLLVSGAFDALAIIAKRAFNIDLKDREASFRRNFYAEKTLLAELQSKGANDLYKITDDQRFQDVLFMLSLLRNTIHGPALRMMSYWINYLDISEVVRLPIEMGKNIWRVAQKLGGHDRWGLIENKHGIGIEPYSFATTLVDEELRYVEAIASAIPIEKLFPNPNAIPEIEDHSQHPGIDEFKWLDRLDLLA